jgi:hypothetical protein
MSPQWEALVITFETMQGTNDAFTSDELYAHLCCFKQKLKQACIYHTEPKQVIFLAQRNVKNFNPSTSCDNFI